MPSQTDALDIVEIYAAASSLEADRIVLLLQEDGIEAMARGTTASSFPSQVEGAYLILVTENLADAACKAIESARAEEAISDKGAFLRS